MRTGGVEKTDSGGGGDAGASKGAGIPFEEGEIVKLGRSLRNVSYALGVVVVALLVCLALVIWLAVEVDDNRDDIDHLEESSTMVFARSANRQETEFGANGYWIEKRRMPLARSDHQVVAVDDYVYIIGGQNADDEVIADVTIYDTVLDSYSPGPTLPTPLYRFGAGYDAENRKIYVFGGFDDAAGQATDAVYVLDVDAEEWTDGPRMPEPRSDHCGVFSDGLLYAAGGYSIDFASTLDTFLALVTSTDEWMELEAIPTPRGDCKCATIGGKVAVIGGYYDPTGTWSPDSFRNEVELYSPEDATWRSAAPLIDPRGDKSVVSLPGDHLLVVGGETHNRGQHTNVGTHHVEEYSLAQDVWVDRPPMPEATFRASAAYVGGMVFVFGGHRQCEIPEDPADPASCIESDTLQVYFI